MIFYLQIWSGLVRWVFFACYSRWIFNFSKRFESFFSSYRRLKDSGFYKTQEEQSASLVIDKNLQFKVEFNVAQSKQKFGDLAYTL